MELLGEETRKWFAFLVNVDKLKEQILCLALLFAWVKSYISGGTEVISDPDMESMGAKVSFRGTGVSQGMLPLGFLL